jgi:DNA polymerase-4
VNGKHVAGGSSRQHHSPLRWVAHVDMDAFFASVEQFDNPELLGKPLIVGNSPLPMERLRELAEAAQRLPHVPEFIKGIRGVVASASYEARRFGVRSAMPLARALALCPHAHVVPGRFGRYREVAATLQKIWSEFSPVVEPMSLDEAYLDLTGIELSEGPIESVGQRLKERIRHVTGLTASVGIAPNRLVAKIASDLRKPDGLVIVDHQSAASTFAPLGVRALPGVGPRTAETFDTLGIKTLGQLASARESLLAATFGVEQARSLISRAAGIDDTPVQVPGDPKSISKETTLAEDETDLNKLNSLLRGLADSVAWTLRDERFHARCVYVKLRLLPIRRNWQPEGSGFGRLITRRCTLPMPIESGQLVYDAACSLLENAHKNTGLASGKETVRLIGVGVASLVPNADLHILAPSVRGGTSKSGPVQLSLHDAPAVVETSPKGAGNPHALDASMDHIRKRFGFGAIAFGTSLNLRDADDGWRSVGEPE